MATRARCRLLRVTGPIVQGSCPAGYAPSLLSGQSTGLALIGAYVLVGELAATEGDHRAAFPAYEREIRMFIGENHDAALAGAQMLIPASRFQSGCATRLCGSPR